MGKIIFLVAGSLSSVISLMLIIFIGVHIKKIETTLKKLGEFKYYKADKKDIINELKSLLDMVIKDHIYDTKYISDMTIQINKLFSYKEFITISNYITIKKINKILKKGISNKNKSRLIFYLSKLIGSVDIRQEYIKNV